MSVGIFSGKLQYLPKNTAGFFSPNIGGKIFFFKNSFQAISRLKKIPTAINLGGGVRAYNGTLRNTGPLFKQRGRRTHRIRGAVPKGGNKFLEFSKMSRLSKLVLVYVST